MRQVERQLPSGGPALAGELYGALHVHVQFGDIALFPFSRNGVIANRDDIRWALVLKQRFIHLGDACIIHQDNGQFTRTTFLRQARGPLQEMFDQRSYLRFVRLPSVLTVDYLHLLDRERAHGAYWSG